MQRLHDLVVVGAGPNGLATAIWAKRSGLDVAVVERGRIAENIAGFPQGLVFFLGRSSTQIGEVPIDSRQSHPTREDVLSYLTRVAGLLDLTIHTSTEFDRLEGSDGNFVLRCRSSGEPLNLHTKKVVLATGVFGQPKRLEIPGVDLPKVAYRYRDPYDFFGQNVAIIGGGNGAAEAALRLHREGRARVTVIDRHAKFATDKWRWQVSDLSELVAAGEIEALHGSRVLRIEPEMLIVETPQGVRRIANDRVLVLIGYRPDTSVFDAAGVEWQSSCAPKIDPQTLETNVKGVYVAGAACAGEAPDLILIAGGRNHGRAIVAHILGQKPPVANLGPQTLMHWMQFHRLADELPRDFALEMVPVVSGDFRDNLLDLYHRKLLQRQAELEHNSAISAEFLWAAPVKLGPVIEELPRELLTQEDGALVYKGAKLPLDALEVLSLADGRRNIREIIEALSERHEVETGAIEDDVSNLILTLIRCGRLFWRAERLPH